jgi:hypothetical protein
MSGVSRIRGWTAGAAALLVLVAVAGCASGVRQQVPPAARNASVSAPGAVVAVVTKTFTPYAATGTLEVPVADHISGSCWTGSIAVPLPGVYRCLANNQIYDPCFAAINELATSTVACVADPWTPAHILTLTQPLPPEPPTSARNPWALELANNARCVAVAGTVPSVAGVSLNYQCGSGVGAGITENDGTNMVVDYGAEDGTALTAVRVTIAWQG